MKHCKFIKGWLRPCSVHAAEAKAAADRAEAEYLESLRGLTVCARHAGAMAQGARTYAWQRALERPLTPCADGTLQWSLED